MEQPIHTDPPELCLPDTIFAFTPVPQQRKRLSGWTAARQEKFIVALEAMGSVGMALRAVGMGRASAYRLREKEGAGSFAAAWDMAAEAGRGRVFDAMMERAINGITTVRILRGGSVTVSGGMDMRLAQGALSTSKIDAVLGTTKETFLR